MENRKIRVLVNAYACSPDMGSEPGMAWNWCTNLAVHCELDIITEGEFRSKIEAALPLLPQGKNMHFHYLPVEEKIRRMCWNQGDWRFYYYYAKWQKRALALAREIIRIEHIDIIHQLNMIGFREPGYLWKIDGVPFVWGPTNVKKSFPTAYLNGATLKQRLFVYVKNFLNGLQLRLGGRPKQAAKCAETVFAASSEAKQSIMRFFHKGAVLLNETACSVQGCGQINTERSFEQKKLQVLWVGRMIFSKQLSIALNAVRLANNKNIDLTILGTGAAMERYKAEAKALGIAEQCHFLGNVPHEEVQRRMREAHVFLFTSVSEGTSTVVLEAIANSLPVLCFNTCGMGDVVSDKIGAKVALTNPGQSAADFAALLNRFHTDRTALKRLSDNCATVRQQLSWQEKAKEIVRTYEKILGR